MKSFRLFFAQIGNFSKMGLIFERSQSEKLIWRRKKGWEKCIQDLGEKKIKI